MSDEKTEQEAIAPDDLKLVDPLADAGKTEEELWDELTAEGDPETEAAEEPEEPEAPAEDDTGDGEAGEEGQEEPGDAPEDVWANADPKLKAEHDKAIEAERRRWEHDVSSNRGRVAALQRQIADLRAAGSQQHMPLADRIAALREDYPEIADTIEQAVAPLESEMEEKRQADQRRLEAAEEELGSMYDHEAQKVEKVHPGWGSFLSENGSAFAEWVNDPNLPRRLYEAALENKDVIVDAAAAAEVITRFKEHLRPAPEPAAKPEPQAQQQSQLKDRRTRQLESTASPRTSRRPVVSGIPEDGDPEALFDMWVEHGKKRSAQL